MSVLDLIEFRLNLPLFCGQIVVHSEPIVVSSSFLDRSGQSFHESRSRSLVGKGPLLAFTAQLSG